MQNKWTVVAFVNHRRIERAVDDAKQGMALVEAFKARGVKAHLISKRKAFEPKGDDPDDGRWWCPYCRRWRRFEVPRGNEDIGPLEPGIGVPISLYYNVCARTNTRVCLWCTMSENDFYITFFNDLWHDAGKKRRRRIRRRKG